MSNRISGTISLFVTLSISSLPALAAKGADNPVMIQKPAMVQPAPAVVSTPLPSKVTPKAMVPPGATMQPAAPPAAAINKQAPAKVMVRPPASVKQVPRSQAMPAPAQVKPPAGVSTPAPAAKFNNPAIHPSAVRDANQARELGNAKEAAEMARTLPGMQGAGDGVNPDLGLGGSKGLAGPGGRAMDPAKLPGHGAAGFENPLGSLAPDLPDNQDKGPSGAALRPSGDLRGAMSGAASTDGVSKSRFQNPDGSHTDVYTRPGGSDTTIVNQRTYNTDGKLVYENTRTFDRDNNQLAEVVDDGDSSTHDGLIDPDDMGTDGTRETIDRMQDPNSDSGSADVSGWAKQFDHSAKSSPQGPNRTNPGPDGATPNPQAPRLMLPEDQIVINPSGENAGGSTRALSNSQQQLRDRVAGPGGRPPGE